jgi:hypothetical protein
VPNTTKGTPYVQSSDLVSAYPTTSLSLANHIDNNLAYNAVTFNNQTGTTYTFVLADASTGRITTASNAAAQTYTVPPETSVAWATGALIRLVNIGAGTVTIAAGAGVTVSNAAGSVAQWESVNILRTGSDTWAVVRGGLPKASYSATTGSPTVTTVSGKTCVQFTGSGSITISQAGTVEVLVIGGGGGGGARIGGGGGAGGYLYDASAYLISGTLTVTVGAGGAGATTGTAANARIGTVSRLGSYYAPGGGGGASSSSAGVGMISQTGSSGGGGAYVVAVQTGASGTTGIGNSGGNGTNSGGESGGGGGGASATGANGSGATAGAGGAGTSSSITGSAVTRAGGGGGGANNGTGGTGGSGGGGAGTGNNTNGTAGTVNTGGGGGGGGYLSDPAGSGGAGGSGLVILLFG